jgi:hypothetical protein
MERVAVTLERTTGFKGGLYDNRPTSVVAGGVPGATAGIEAHDTPGFSVEHADNVTLKDCSVVWGKNAPEEFSYVVEAKDTTGLKIEGLKGEAARAALGKAVSIS